MRALARLAIAAVWLYQGGWCKLVAPNERHLRIVADLPGVGPAHARKVLALVGSVEVALAAWVLTGRAPRTAPRTRPSVRLKRPNLRPPVERPAPLYWRETTTATDARRQPQPVAAFRFSKK